MCECDDGFTGDACDEEESALLIVLCVEVVLILLLAIPLVYFLREEYKHSKREEVVETNDGSVTETSIIE